MSKSIQSYIVDLLKIKSSQQLTLTGRQDLELQSILQAAYRSPEIILDPDSKTKNRRKTILKHMRSQLKHGDHIYGVTSSYGGQANQVLDINAQNNIYNRSKKLTRSIVHVDVSTGPEIPIPITRAALLIRINMLLPGYSAVRLSTLKKIAALLNLQLTPIVGFYGTLGASGDLAHNGRLLSVLTQFENVYIKDKSNKKLTAKTALDQAGIPQLKLEPKEGLGIVNGDNFSTAACLIQAHQTLQLMQLHLFSSALTIQALKGSNRNFHPLLSHVRPHPGQKYAADKLRLLLKDSQIAYQEMQNPKKRRKGVIIQDGYSIRCMPQYVGPDWEALVSIFETIQINANSVSDNPLWTTPSTTTPGEEPYQWISGGNFLAMHMSESLDRLRKILIHIVKQNDRHLNRLVNPHLNQGLPANLSHESDISQCTFKGIQTQMGMYEVYASSLATPISTAFGIHEELNQDLTSHAMTSALYNQKVLEITRLAIASNLIASCQAIDFRGGPNLLSPATQQLYHWTREYISFIKEPQPLGHIVEEVASHLHDPKLIGIISAE